MSYCRWSSDNWRCDLYCYEDVSGGWTTHVASRRRVGLENIPPNPMDRLGELSPDEFHRLYQEHHEVLKTLPFEDIELPHAGETFNDPTLEAFKDRLLYLRGLGYHFSDHVLDAVNQEIADAAAQERDTG